MRERADKRLSSHQHKLNAKKYIRVLKFDGRTASLRPVPLAMTNSVPIMQFFRPPHWSPSLKPMPVQPILSVETPFKMVASAYSLRDDDDKQEG